uniref:PH domain-containing protein n=1 Tax=Haemonchus contortus TaxID=6289 RepID=A0A7I4Y7P7_HAECO
MLAPSTDRRSTIGWVASLKEILAFGVTQASPLNLMEVKSYFVTDRQTDRQKDKSALYMYICRKDEPTYIPV